MNEPTQYVQYIKPLWAPPSWLFGPVWTVLYAVIIASYGYVGWLYWQGRLPFIVVLPFILNVIFNLAFTPIQFGLKNNLLAAGDILLVLATLAWALWAIWPHAPWVSYINLPYLGWVLFATVLQLTITKLNW